jgi:hypothetical protein
LPYKDLCHTPLLPADGQATGALSAYRHGKTGGTAIHEALHDAPRPLIFHYHRTTLKDIRPGDRVAFIVRDPISRFVSGFYSRQRQGQPRYYSPWSPGEKLAFERFPTANDLAMALSSKDPLTRKLAMDAMNAIEHVKTHFKYWLVSEDYLLERKSDIIFIGRQESLAQDFEILKHSLDLPATHLPDDPLRAHKNPSESAKNLEPEAKENLRIWYQDDYQLLEVISRLFDEISEADKKELKR